MPQAQAYYKESGEKVPDSELDAALRSGQASFKQDAEIKITDGYGIDKTVSPAELPDALAQGGQVWSQATTKRSELTAEAASTTGFLQGSGEALGRGLTAGLLDPALVALGASPEKMRTRREVMGGVGTALEVAGAVAPAFVSGGSSLAARGVTGIGRAGLAAGEAAGAGVARTLGGGLGARVAGGVVGGAVEGALFGAGQGVSDAVLNEVDPEDFAEKVLASAGTGLLLGGVLGGVGGAFARRAAPEGPIARETLEAATERATGTTRKALADVPSAMESATEAAAITKGGYGAAKAIKAMEQGAGAVAETLGATPIGKPIAQAARNVQKAARFGREVVEGFGGSATVADRAVVRATTGADQKLLAEAERLGEASIASTARKHNLLGYNAEKQATQAAKLANDSQRSLDRIAQTADTTGARVDAARFVADTEDQLASLRKIDDSAAQSLAKDLDRKLEPIRSQVAKGKEYSLTEWADLRNRFNKGVEWDKLASEGKSTSEFTSILDRFDEGIESTLEREQADAWRTLQREKRDLDFLSRSMSQQAKKQAEEGGLLSLQTLMGGEGGALGMGALGGLVTGAPLAGIAIGAGKSIATKAVQRYGDVFKAKLLDVASGADMGLGRAATKLVEGAKTPIRVSATYDMARSEPDPTRWEGKRLEEKYRAAEAEIRELQDPEVMAERMSRTAEALEDQPAIAGALMAQAQRAVDYLASMVPVDLADEHSLTPQLEAGYIHPEQMQQFLSAKWGIDSPFSVIDGLSDGNINWDAIRAVKAVYPKLFTRLQELAVQEAMTRKEPLEYNQRVLLGLALDLPAEETLRPDVLSRIQAAKFLPPEEAEESIPGPKPRRGIDVSAQYALPNPE